MGRDTGESLSLTFWLPSFPPSINKLYDINHRQRRVYLSDDALLWKTRTIPFVKPCRWPADWLFELQLEYQSPSWLTKDGKVRRRDVQNMDKITIDLLFAKWGYDDSRLVQITTSKRWGLREQIRVTVEKSEIVLKEQSSEQTR